MAPTPAPKHEPFPDPLEGAAFRTTSESDPKLELEQVGHDYYLPLEAPSAEVLGDRVKNILDHLNNRPDERISDFVETHQKLLAPYAREVASHNFPEPENGEVRAIAEKWIVQLELETAIKTRLTAPEGEVKQLASEMEEHRTGGHSEFMSAVKAYAEAMALQYPHEEQQYVQDLITEIEFGHNRLTLDDAETLATAVAHRTIPDNDQKKELVEKTRDLFRSHALRRLSASEVGALKGKLHKLGLSS